jgi:hypothetical protein
MTLGGIPYYLSLLKASESLVQNIDRLFFSPNGTLRTEFEELYNALFNQADGYIHIVQALAKHRNGLTNPGSIPGLSTVMWSSIWHFKH